MLSFISGIIMRVLIFLKAVVPASGSVNGGHPDIMPVDISQFSYHGITAITDMARIWTRADLNHAPSVLNFEQMWPVIRRLEAGLPIAVLAFGDSITKDHGGCYHSDR